MLDSVRLCFFLGGVEEEFEEYYDCGVKKRICTPKREQFGKKLISFAMEHVFMEILL